MGKEYGCCIVSWQGRREDISKCLPLLQKNELESGSVQAARLHRGSHKMFIQTQFWKPLLWLIHEIRKIQTISKLWQRRRFEQMWLFLCMWDSEHNSVAEEKKKTKILDIYWTLWIQLYWQTSGFVCRRGHYFVLTYSTWQIHSLPLLYLKMPLLFLFRQKWKNETFYLQCLTGKKLVNSRQRMRIIAIIFPFFILFPKSASFELAVPPSLQKKKKV